MTQQQIALEQLREAKRIGNERADELNLKLVLAFYYFSAVIHALVAIAIAIDGLNREA